MLDDWRWRQFNFTGNCAQDLGDTRLERTKVNAMGMVFQHGKAQATLLRRKAIAIGTATQHKVEHSLRPAPGLESCEQLAGVAPLDTRSSSCYLTLDERRQAHIIEESYIGLRPLSPKNNRQAQKYLPLLWHPCFTLTDSGSI